MGMGVRGGPTYVMRESFAPRCKTKNGRCKAKNERCNARIGKTVAPGVDGGLVRLVRNCMAYHKDKTRSQNASGGALEGQLWRRNETPCRLCVREMLGWVKWGTLRPPHIGRGMSMRARSNSPTIRHAPPPPIEMQVPKWHRSPPPWPNPSLATTSLPPPTQCSRRPFPSLGPRAIRSKRAMAVALRPSGAATPASSTSGPRRPAHPAARVAQDGRPHDAERRTPRRRLRG